MNYVFIGLFIYYELGLIPRSAVNPRGYRSSGLNLDSQKFDQRDVVEKKATLHSTI